MAGLALDIVADHAYAAALRVADAWARVRQRRAVEQIAPTMCWLEKAEPARSTLVTIVMPTLNRAPLLRQAIASVVAQRHIQWELLIADDGSDDDSVEVARAFDDVRVKVLQGSRSGCSGARNRALDAASGEVIAFLDDDNIMHPLWLHAVAWAFGSDERLETLYGARILEGGEHVIGMTVSPLPQYHFVPYSARLLRLVNFIDIGVFAYRLTRRTEGYRFRPDLSQAADWDFIRRVIADGTPVALPAVANFYRTGAAGRLTRSDSRRETRLLRGY